MLNNLKHYWAMIIAGAIALAYLIGIKKGQDYEKAQMDKKTVANVSRAVDVRAAVGTDANAARRLRDKYTRK